MVIMKALFRISGYQKEEVIRKNERITAHSLPLVGELNGKILWVLADIYKLPLAFVSHHACRYYSYKFIK